MMFGRLLFFTHLGAFAVASAAAGRSASITSAFASMHLPSASRKRFRHRREYTNTALKVSELHVPGYAQSKLPFIHPDDTRGGSPTATLLKERTYNPNFDYTSLIPYQNGHLIHKTTTPIFTPQECQMMLDEAERKACQMGWTTTRHGNYPTTDLPIIELPDTLEFLRLALVERIYPLLRTQFGEFLPDGGKNLRVADGFVVKYDADGGQTELKPHRDGSVLSFNIALNPASEFEGGGTWFHSLDDSVKIDQGEVVSHSSSLLHGGHGITRGKRYIMVCFVILEGYDSWSMRFYNQVRNTALRWRNDEDLVLVQIKPQALT